MAPEAIPANDLNSESEALKPALELVQNAEGVRNLNRVFGDDLKALGDVASDASLNDALMRQPQTSVLQTIRAANGQ
ncbi:hypothetical protein KY385_02640 [Candidatus Parcubacteria bacterium]|nr:hypothetical protein [Candidatus Parcubacteria bacterium]